MNDHLTKPPPQTPQWEEQMADDLIGNAPEGTAEMTVTRIIQQSKGGPRVLATIHLELADLRANGDSA